MPYMNVEKMFLQYDRFAFSIACSAFNYQSAWSIFAVIVVMESFFSFSHEIKFNITTASITET